MRGTINEVVSDEKKLETKTTEKNCGEIYSWRFWPKVYLAALVDPRP